MALIKPIVVEVWAGDWGLPSIDLDSLRILTVVKFSGYVSEVKKANNPFWTKNGTLPVVYHGKHVFMNFEDVMAYLNLKNCSPDQALTAVQVAEVVAYTNMLKEKLLPALQYVWWIDEKNYFNLTRPWYAKIIPFPFNLYYPKKYLSQAQTVMNALYELENPADIETKVYKEAEKCLTSLSVRLGKDEFMFGQQPTSIDATVFAFLAPLLKAPFKNPILQNHLKACTNLHKFVSRICQRYFPKDYKAYEIKAKEQNQKAQQPVDSDYPNKRRNQIIASIFALLAMISYAFSTGMVKIPRDFKFSKMKLELNPQNLEPNINFSSLWDWTRMDMKPLPDMQEWSY